MNYWEDICTGELSNGPHGDVSWILMELSPMKKVTPWQKQEQQQQHNREDATWYAHNNNNKMGMASLKNPNLYHKYSYKCVVCRWFEFDSNSNLIDIVAWKG